MKALAQTLHPPQPVANLPPESHRKVRRKQEDRLGEPFQVQQTQWGHVCEHTPPLESVRRQRSSKHVGGIHEWRLNCITPPGGLFCGGGGNDVSWVRLTPPSGLFSGGGGNVSWVRRADGNAMSTTPPGEGFGRHDGSADILTRLEAASSY